MLYTAGAASVGFTGPLIFCTVDCNSVPFAGLGTHCCILLVLHVPATRTESCAVHGANRRLFGARDQTAVADA